MKRRLMVALPLLVFASIAVFLAIGLGKDPSIIPSPLIGKPAPSYTLPRLYEPSETLSGDSLKGHPYLLNVWASWCTTCRYEHPVVTRLAEQNVIPVIGLNYKDERSEAMRWLEFYGDPYTAHAVDTVGGVGIDFGVYKVPESFLIDANGIIRFKQTGAITDQVLDEQIRPLIDQLLAEAQG